MASPQTRALARRIRTLERARLASKQANLGFSTIDGGAVQAQDDTGVLTMVVGTQFDGTSAPTVVTGPPPPTPTLPLVTSQPGSLRVYWDGTWVDGAVAPMDFARVQAYAVPLASYAAPEPLNQAIMIGQFNSATGGEITAALDPGVEYAVYLHAWTISGKYGPSSDVATGTPDSQATGADVAALSTVYRQDTAPWPDGDTGHTDDYGDLWFNTSLGPGALFNVTSRSVTANVATVQTDKEHDVTVGKLVAISGVDPTFDGSFTVTAVTADTISYALVTADVPTLQVYAGTAQGQDIKPLNRAYIWDATNAWVLTQDSDISNAASLNQEIKTVQQDMATLAVTALDAQNTAYAADGRVSISDYEPGPDDVLGKNEGSLWITRTRDRANLIMNPSFEVSTANWGSFGLTSFVRTAVAVAGEGEYALRITNNANAAQIHYVNSNLIPVSVDQDVVGSIYAKSVSGLAAGTQIFLNFYTSGLAFVSGVVSDPVTLSTDDWTRMWTVGKVPAGAAYAFLGAAMPAANANAVWDIDAALFETGTRLGRYFDGNSEGGAWVGALNNSASTLDGNAIIRLFTLEDAAWTEKFWTADTISSVNASVIDRGSMDGQFIADNTIAIDKQFVPTATAAEGLTAGDLVYVTMSGGLAMVYKADANAGRRADGFVLDTVSTGGLVKVYYSGYNPLCTGLLPGPQFLDAVAGKCSSAPPIISGTLVQPVGYATDATTLVFQSVRHVNLV